MMELGETIINISAAGDEVLESQRSQQKIFMFVTESVILVYVWKTLMR
jgi:hypothetical protein